MSSDSGRASVEFDEIRHLVNVERYPIHKPGFAQDLRSKLDQHGALVLPGFFTPGMVDTVLNQSLPRIDEAFFTVDQTHNVYLTPPDPTLAASHIYNHQVISTKGCLAHDQIEPHSPLQTVYNSALFRSFLCRILGLGTIHPYADTVSGINVHFHLDGQELGWHFDNSSFAVTALMQAPNSGGVFEYVSNLRNSSDGDQHFPGVAAVIRPTEQSPNGSAAPTIQSLEIEPGALVLFRGRDSMHRVTPSQGPTPRVLVVFAYNAEPGIGLSEAAKQTFYGRSG